MTADFRTFERRLDRTSLILTLIASLCAFLLYSARAALSLALGGVLSAINFHWLKQAVDYVILQGGTGPLGLRLKLQYAGRYALIAITLYVTIHFSFLDPALILAGLLVYVVAILLECIFEIAKS